MERRLSLHARQAPGQKTMRAALAIAALLAATPAIAAPKGKAAKAAFDRGVSAYTKGDFAAVRAAAEQV